MANNAPPSKNPADEGSLAGTLNFILRKFLQKVDDMLPATVIAYDRVKNVATVQPQIMLMTTDNQTVTRCQYASIPVFSFGGGGIGINFPLQPGDTGWIHANDQDISLYLQAQAEAAPNTKRLHSFRDGMFFPDAMRKVVIDSEDEDALVIQLFDNSTKIAVHRNGKIKIKASVEVDIVAPDIKLTGNLDVQGNVSTTGTLTNNAKNVGSTHTHGGVTVGAGTTGTPT